RRGDDDAIEWCYLRPSVIAVAAAYMDGVVAEFGQPCCRLLGQARYTLDRIDLMPELGQHGGLITGAGADFEDASARREAQQVGHQGDDVRLRNSLTEADWQRSIGIGQIALGGRHKRMARYVTHGLQHGGIERGRRRTAAAFTRYRLNRAHHVK